MSDETQDQTNDTPAPGFDPSDALSKITSGLGELQRVNPDPSTDLSKKIAADLIYYGALSE